MGKRETEAFDIGKDYLQLKEQFDLILNDMASQLEDYKKSPKVNPKAVKIRETYINKLREFEAKTEEKLLTLIQLTNSLTKGLSETDETATKYAYWMIINGIHPREVESFSEQELKKLSRKISLRRNEKMFLPELPGEPVQYPKDPTKETVLDFLEAIELEAKICNAILRAQNGR